MSDTATVTVYTEDAGDIAHYLGVECDHWDHHGYCQTHGLGEAVTTSPARCSIGRILATLAEAEGTEA